MIDNNEIKTGGLVSFLGKHPVVVISLSILLCSGVGYWSEYRLMQAFGVNIVVFAEADDFLLAAFKNPIIFIISFPIFAIGLSFIWLQTLRYSKINAELKRLEIEIRSDFNSANPQEIERRVFESKSNLFHDSNYNPRLAGLALGATILSSVLALFFLVHFETISQLEKIRENPTHYSTIELRTNRILLPKDDHKFVLITATENYIFFYKGHSGSEGETYILPSASVASIRQYPSDTDFSVVEEKFTPTAISVKLDDSRIADLYGDIAMIGDEVKHLNEFEYKYYTSANLNFRNGPSRNNKVFYILKENTEIELISSTKIWSNIRDIKADKSGWVHSRYLKPVLANKTNKVLK